MKICIVGCGAIGGLLAGYLAKTAAEITVVERGEQLLALRERGLLLHEATGNCSRIDTLTVLDSLRDCGMIMDFGDIKALANEHLVNLWDHAFIVYEKDTAVRAFLDSMPNHKTVVIDRVPTVENLAKTAFDILKDVYHDRFGRHLSLTKVTLYETPNCWAEVDA